VRRRRGTVGGTLVIAHEHGPDERRNRKVTGMVTVSAISWVVHTSNRRSGESTTIESGYAKGEVPCDKRK
jgi:hypothetical protein